MTREYTYNTKYTNKKTESKRLENLGRARPENKNRRDSWWINQPGLGFLSGAKKAQAAVHAHGERAPRYNGAGMMVVPCEFRALVSPNELATLRYAPLSQPITSAWAGGGTGCSPALARPGKRLELKKKTALDLRPASLHSLKCPKERREGAKSFHTGSEIYDHATHTTPHPAGSLFQSN